MLLLPYGHTTNVPGFVADVDVRCQAPLVDAVSTADASDGWFVMQVAREHQFEALAELVGQPGWLTDERFATRAGWGTHTEDVIRPAIEVWAADKT